MGDEVLPDPEAEQLRRCALTYAEVGSTAGTLPAGYHHLDRSVVIGTGLERFERAVDSLLRWEMHRRAGLSVRPSRGQVAQDAVAVLRLGWGAMGVSAPVRVVYMVEEDRRRGFAYGTLPGHPEQGEEAFLVELRGSEDVALTIRAFSRPASALARVGGPLSRAIQHRVTRRYFGAL